MAYEYKGLKWQREGEKEPSGKEMLFNAACVEIDRNQEEIERHSIPIESNEELAEYFKKQQRGFVLNDFAALVERMDEETLNGIIEDMLDEFVDCRTP